MGWVTNEYGDEEPTGVHLQRAVLGCLRECGPLEAGQVAIELGTELRRTQQAIADMHAAGTVARVGYGESRGGQPPTVWGVA